MLVRAGAGGVGLFAVLVGAGWCWCVRPTHRCWHVCHACWRCACIGLFVLYLMLSAPAPVLALVFFFDPLVFMLILAWSSCPLALLACLSVDPSALVLVLAFALASALALVLVPVVVSMLA